MSLLAATIRSLTNARALDVAVVDTNGDQLSGFDSSRPANATLTTVAASATSVSLLVSNTARRQVFIQNDGNADLRVAFAATASATAYTVLIPKNGQWDSVLNSYTGAIAGIWTSATGSARITEVTT